MGDGCALQIIELDEVNHTYNLNENLVKKVFNHEKLRNCHLSVISVAGALRTGKSFLLSFFIKYLKSKYEKSLNAEEWLDDDTEALSGFSWRSGSERNTTGILIWSKIFIDTLPNGKKVGIVIMDTQGTFDTKSTVRDNVIVFALSTMMSSVQVFNIFHNLQEDNLRSLEFFAEYGKAISDQSDYRPFQKLLFIIRDWSFPYDAPFGYQGGRKILDRFLKITNNQAEELQSVRKNIKNTFDEVDCFLMPYPGKKVVTSPNFNGRLRDIDEDFVEQLKTIIPDLLKPANLVLKRIDSKFIVAGDFLEYLRTYLNLFASNKLPEPKNIFIATVEAQNLSAIQEAKCYYTELMDNASHQTKYLSTNDLLETHKKCNSEALNKFANIPKLSTTELSGEFYNKLEKMLEERLNYYIIRNERNNPKNDETIKELIDTVTSQKDRIEEMNSKNSEALLYVVGMFQNALEENKKWTDENKNILNQIQELWNRPPQQQQSGGGFWGFIADIVEHLPIITTAVTAVTSLFKKH